jgi:hypothetical protein
MSRLLILPNEILLNIFNRLTTNEQCTLSQTEKRLNYISHEPNFGFLTKKLLNTIKTFHLKVFYSYEAKRDEHYHIEEPHIYTISPIKRNNTEITNILNGIRILLLKGADPNSYQFLHEAVFLYFIYKDLEISIRYKNHDHTEPDNQHRLISLLLEYGAKSTLYKHETSDWEYQMYTFERFHNFLNHLKFGSGLTPKQMDGMSPIDYAANFKDQYPEMYEDLVNLK